MQCANISTINKRRPGHVTRVTNILSVFLSEDPGISYVSSPTYRYSISRIRFSGFFMCVLATCLSLKPSCAGLLLCLPVSLCPSMSLRRDPNKCRKAEQILGAMNTSRSRTSIPALRITQPLIERIVGSLSVDKAAGA